MSVSNANLQRASTLVATALIVTVVTQILYLALLGGPQPSDPAAGLTNADIAAYFTDRWNEVAIVWTVEAITFITIAVGALFAMVDDRRRLGWAAIAIAGILNIVQIGIGLTLFKPVALAGEDYTWMFWAVVSGAFGFYFIAKIALGIAAAVFGLSFMREAVGLMGRIIGGLTLAVGTLAAISNIAALGAGMNWLFVAGGSGTLAALLLGIVLAISGKDRKA
ncbi:hypothetical protein [Aurantiacibacter marinus]|uniref:hypothetical protein n=1 Tax=Aurantiacibacter marinus TaxID=874156 RepID=UPI00069C3D6B|nr:hypothetical protein [Aurantiacibacter marinus]